MDQVTYSISSPCFQYECKQQLKWVKDNSLSYSASHLGWKRGVLGLLSPAHLKAGNGTKGFHAQGRLAALCQSTAS